jgi:hypothetical protein
MCAPKNDNFSMCMQALDCKMVGRCRLIVSEPELKARLVSALETRMS